MQKIGTKITVTIPDEMLKDIEEIAKHHSMTKAKACRLLLKIGIDNYQIAKISGVAQLAEVADNARKKLLKKSTKAAKKNKR